MGRALRTSFGRVDRLASKAGRMVSGEGFGEVGVFLSFRLSIIHNPHMYLCIDDGDK